MFLMCLAVLSSAAPVFAIDFKDTKRKAEAGNATAQYNLGIIYYNGYEGVKQNKSEAAKWYLKAAKQGIPEAQHNIALMYYDGEGVPKNKSEALKWWRRAAEQGVAEAQYNLGFLYGTGEGVKQNNPE
ncbi:MAG: sel1 repeat family protein, partial [Synergistaceae bacterium]|nr:sel1 repeat family protein [Synergistaceae bacterium]